MSRMQGMSRGLKKGMRYGLSRPALGLSLKASEGYKASLIRPTLTPRPNRRERRSKKETP